MLYGNHIYDGLSTMEGMETHGVLSQDLKVPSECGRASHAQPANKAPAHSWLACLYSRN